MKIFKWNVEKNAWLYQHRGITFEEIVQKLESGVFSIETDHPNSRKYPNQKIIVIVIDDYVYLVPFVKTGEEYFLKTIIPSRKATKKYRGVRHE